MKPGKPLRFFRSVCPAPVALLDNDICPSPEKSALEWAKGLFSDGGIDLGGGHITLVTFPRTWFYRFAPISLYLGYDGADTLRGILYKVNNTFGESHSYLAATSGPKSTHGAEKAFYVSPFFDVEGSYRFRISDDSDRLFVSVENIVAGQKTHIATLDVRRSLASTPAILRHLITSPFASLGVMVAIHWEAFFLWLKGARYRSRPAPPDHPYTPARAAPLKPEVKEDLQT